MSFYRFILLKIGVWFIMKAGFPYFEFMINPFNSDSVDVLLLSKSKESLNRHYAAE